MPVICWWVTKRLAVWWCKMPLHRFRHRVTLVSTSFIATTTIWDWSTFCGQTAFYIFVCPIWHRTVTIQIVIAQIVSAVKCELVAFCCHVDHRRKTITLRPSDANFPTTLVLVLVLRDSLKTVCSPCPCLWLCLSLRPRSLSWSLSCKCWSWSWSLWLVNITDNYRHIVDSPESQWSGRRTAIYTLHHKHVACLTNPFLHRPFPLLPDWLHGLSDHLTFLLCSTVVLV